LFNDALIIGFIAPDGMTIMMNWEMGKNYFKILYQHLLRRIRKTAKPLRKAELWA
jgi:hypothetical protein